MTAVWWGLFIAGGVVGWVALFLAAVLVWYALYDPGKDWYPREPYTPRWWRRRQRGLMRLAGREAAAREKASRETVAREQASRESVPVDFDQWDGRDATAGVDPDAYLAREEAGR